MHERWTVQYITFAERVLREYCGLQKSPLHFNRRKILKAAVAQAMSQVRPKTNLPHDGNKDVCVEFLMPHMEKVFQVPNRAGNKGSASWVSQIIKADDFTFSDCSAYPLIMKHYVRRRMKMGHNNGRLKGFPIKLEKEEVPTRDDIYECHSGMPYRKGATRPHRDVPFLRGASADGAILALKNGCKYLVRVKADEMPGGKEWSNFAEVCLLSQFVLTSIDIICVNTDSHTDTLASICILMLTSIYILMLAHIYVYANIHIH